MQHQLRAHTPNDAKALRATVSTYPTSDYDLEEVLQQLGIGEAVVTVMSERGAPTPVAWTRIFAPESRMGPTDPDHLRAGVEQSALMARYGTPLDRQSAYEVLTRQLAEGAAAAEAEAAQARWIQTYTALDNVRLLDVTPQLDIAFGPTTVTRFT